MGENMDQKLWLLGVGLRTLVVSVGEFNQHTCVRIAVNTYAHINNVSANTDANLVKGRSQESFGQRVLSAE